jgi:hypothetical protein
MAGVAVNPSAQADPIPARTSASFVDSMGVGTHLDCPFPIYRDDFSSVICPALAEMGIKHIRDGVSVWSPLQVSHIQYLYSHLGITDFLVFDCNGDNHTNILGSDKVTSAIKTYLPEVDAIECSNEPDISTWKDSNGAARYYMYDNLGGGAVDSIYDSANGWDPGFCDPKSTNDGAHAVVKEAEDLYSIVKRDASFNNVKVCMPPFANPASYLRYSSEDIAQMNAIGIADYGGGHYYTGGLCADVDCWRHDLAWSSPNGFIAGSESIKGPNTPVYVGETGYHNDLKFQNGDQGVSERAAGIYIPLFYCEAFRQLPAGSRLYVYELADHQADPDMTDDQFHYGAFLRSDGSKKPAFYAVKNLISIVKDPKPDNEFAPGKLAVTIEGAPATLHDTLLQNSSGVYYLLLWNDVSVFNIATASTPGSDINPATAPITLQFKNKLKFAVYAPSGSTGAAATTSYTEKVSGNMISLDAPAELLVLEIKTK